MNITGPDFKVQNWAEFRGNLSVGCYDYSIDSELRINAPESESIFPQL